MASENVIGRLTQSEVDVSLAAAHYQHVWLVEERELGRHHRRVHRNRHEELDGISVAVE